MYCGDGINDLEALAAADVGMAVGAADASAAATFSDKHLSVAGQLSSLASHALPALFLHQKDTKMMFGCVERRTTRLQTGRTQYPFLVTKGEAMQIYCIVHKIFGC